MTVTAEQATAELRRRAAIKELQRRNMPALASKSTTGESGASTGISERQFNPQQAQRIQLLQKQLGGRIPSKAEPRRFRGAAQEGFGVSVPQITGQSESYQRSAYDALQKEFGFSPEDIAGALAFEKGMKPPSKLPQAVGSAVGGLVASKLIPGPADDIAIGARLLRGTGKAAIAGLGGTAGKAIQMVADPDMEFNRAELAKAFGEETALEAATLGLAPIGRRLIRPVKKTAIEGASELSARLAQRGKDLGIQTPTRFLPAQFSENQLIDTIQGIGENSLVGSNALFQYKRGQLKAAGSLVDDLAETISKGAAGRSSDDVAALLTDAVGGGRKAHSMAASKLYQGVDEVIGTEIVNLNPTRAIGQEAIDRAAKASNIGITPTSRTLMRQITSAPETVSFQTAQDMRSGLLDIIRKGTSKVSPDPKAVGIAKQLVSSIDSQMAEAARAAGPEAETLWRRANKFFKAGKDRFDNKTIRTLVKQLSDPALSKPEVANVIFKSRNNILRVKKAAGKEAFQKAKGAWVQNIVRNSMLPDPSDIRGIGEPVGTKILKAFNGAGQDALNAAFTTAEQTNIRESARIMAIVQAKTGGQAGALRFVQGAALAGVVAGPLTGEQVGREAAKGGGVLLIGPAVLGRLMASPTFGRLLSEGYKAPPGTQQSVALTARLIRNVMQARRKVNADRQKLRAQEKSQELMELHRTRLREAKTRLQERQAELQVSL